MSKKIVFSVVCALFCLMILEVCLRGLIFFKHLYEGNLYQKVLIPLLYKQETWAKELYQIPRNEYHFEPYTMWRQSPNYRSTYVNADSLAYRVTPSNIYSLDRSDVIKIACFGGSTLWGEGARDHKTIPNILIEKLLRKGVKAYVMNYGVSSYCSYQEMILFINELRKIDYDVAIFYDGFNDILGVFESGLPHGPIGYFQVKDKYEKSIGFSDLQNYLLNNIKIIAVSRKIADRIVGMGGAEQYDKFFVGNAWNPQHADRMAEEYYQFYRYRLHLIRQWGEERNCRVMFIFQPSLFTKIPVQEEEIRSIDISYSSHYIFRNEKIKKFYEFCVKQFEKSDEPDLYLFHKIFNDQSEPFYLDACHITESGNELVADRIVQIMESDFSDVFKSASQSSGL